MNYRPHLFAASVALITFIVLQDIHAQAPPPAPAAPGAAPAAPSGVETKTAEDFSGLPWAPSPWNNVTATTSIEKDAPPGAKTPNSLKVVVHFAGTGEFQHCEVLPAKPIYIPGNAHSVTMWFKIGEPGYEPRVNFIDGWGADHIPQRLNWDPRIKGTDWQTFTFKIPEDWVRPIGIVSISNHNFEHKTTKIDSTYWIGPIVAETNISDVDPVTGKLKSWTPETNAKDPKKALTEVPITPLLTVNMATGVEGNVFPGTTPHINLQISNWKPGTLTGTGVFTVTDSNGAKVTDWTENISVDSQASFSHDIQTSSYGLFNLAAAIKLSDGSKLDQKLAFARVPEQKQLTEEQKIASPYGLNVHSGGERMFHSFHEAGIYWFRDYAFNFSQLTHSASGDGKFSGWPYFPSIINDYQKEGAIVMPVLFSIKPPEFKDGKAVKVGPDQDWKRFIAQVILGFPSVHYWEISNEYDGAHTPEEQRVNWENYLLYHKKFGELLDILGSGNDTFIENGRAGIFPKHLEQFVKSGKFDRVNVVNVHYYTGPDAPELSLRNYNTGSGSLQDGTIYGNLYDMLRATKRAGVSDGKQRQAWLTEFGWDTKAGPIVSDEEQSAFLQRGFLLAFAAGIDKAFWFYNFDVEKPAVFFDGCGLFTFEKEPKLSYTSMAGLTTLLPRPHYVGTISAGPNTWGYVFENDGQLVAGLWALKGKAPKVTFKAEQLYDFQANKLNGMSADLTILPVYAVGLDKSDPLYLQTAYELDTPYVSETSAGDPVDPVIIVTNNRAQELKATFKLTLPTGWTAEKPEQTITVAPGGKQEVHLTYTVNPDEKLGSKDVGLICQENGKTIKTIQTSVMVRRPFDLQVGSINGAPGKTTIPVTVTNRSALPQSGKLLVKVPSEWQTSAAEIPVSDIKPGESHTTPIDLTWTPEWKDGESASVTFAPQRGAGEERPIIPPQFFLHKVSGLTLDGDLSKWPKNTEFPVWMLGSTSSAPQARVWLAWAPEGIYGAVDVHDTKGDVPDPKTFWASDTLEMYLSTRDKDAADQFESGDHHFWFSPLTKEKRVYAGQWKTQNEIPDTIFDLSGVKSVAKKTADGYTMEFLLPAAAIKGWNPSDGNTIGLNFSLTAMAPTGERQVFWPRSKASEPTKHADDWGRIKLLP